MASQTQAVLKFSYCSDSRVSECLKDMIPGGVFSFRKKINFHGGQSETMITCKAPINQRYLLVKQPLEGSRQEFNEMATLIRKLGEVNVMFPHLCSSIQGRFVILRHPSGYASGVKVKDFPTLCRTLFRYHFAMDKLCLSGRRQNIILSDCVRIMAGGDFIEKIAFNWMPPYFKLVIAQTLDHLKAHQELLSASYQNIIGDVKGIFFNSISKAVYLSTLPKGGKGLVEYDIVTLSMDLHFDRTQAISLYRRYRGRALTKEEVKKFRLMQMLVLTRVMCQSFIHCFGPSDARSRARPLMERASALNFFSRCGLPLKYKLWQTTKQDFQKEGLKALRDLMIIQSMMLK